MRAVTNFDVRVSCGVHNSGPAIGISEIPLLATAIVRQEPQGAVRGRSVDSPGGQQPPVRYPFLGIAPIPPFSSWALTLHSRWRFLLPPSAHSAKSHFHLARAPALEIYGPADCGETNGASRCYSLTGANRFREGTVRVEVPRRDECSREI